MARLTHTTSKFGVEYDSLADLASFTLAPAVMIYSLGLHQMGRVGWVASFLFFACGALRLARFNVEVGKQEKRYFKGLPTPIAAGFISMMVMLHLKYHWGDIVGTFYVMVIAFALAFLMVSNVKYYSFKEIDWHNQRSFTALISFVILIMIVALNPVLVVFLMMLSYITFGLFNYIRQQRQVIVHRINAKRSETLDQNT